MYIYNIYIHVCVYICVYIYVCVVWCVHFVAATLAKFLEYAAGTKDGRPADIVFEEFAVIDGSAAPRTCPRPSCVNATMRCCRKCQSKGEKSVL